MQFKYPEILWGLFLLLIPIIIHLFQLRRFKNTPFTNVKFLKEVVSESRKSSTLKKWLLLFTRMFMFAALIVAFAQPFFANQSALQKKETVFYLDDSFSMGLEDNGTTLFQNLVQEFIQKIPKDQTFSLFTNNQSFQKVEIEDIQNSLLNIPLTSQQLELSQVQLKGETYFSDENGIQKNLVLISDFQQRMGEFPKDTTATGILHIVKTDVSQLQNSSIDSVYLLNKTTENVEVVALLSTNTPIENIPVSLFNGNQLIAKTSAKFNSTLNAEVTFTINTNAPILGKISIEDQGLGYDNEFYFNIDTKAKIKVMSIGENNQDFLSRIYTDDEFQYENTSLEQLNYGALDNMNLVILNELEKLPTALVTALNTFIKNGGNLILIPAPNANLESYNVLISNYGNSQFLKKNIQEIPISNVNDEHPIFKNVFETKVANFQFPTVKEYYTLQSTLGDALRLQNTAPFLSGEGQVFIFSAPLNPSNSNFINSPLIVPTFYTIGTGSIKLPPLYAQLGTTTEIEVPVSLSQDDIVRVTKDSQEFIPQQRVLPKKVSLIFEENPKEDGIYTIIHEKDTLRNISFNYNRKESELIYINLTDNNLNSSLTDFFQEYEKNNAINEFWKWFAILALVFVLIETALQRFLK